MGYFKFPLSGGPNGPLCADCFCPPAPRCMTIPAPLTISAVISGAGNAPPPNGFSCPGGGACDNACTGANGSLILTRFAGTNFCQVPDSWGGGKVICTSPNPGPCIYDNDTSDGIIVVSSSLGMSITFGGWVPGMYSIKARFSIGTQTGTSGSDFVMQDYRLDFSAPVGPGTYTLPAISLVGGQACAAPGSITITI